MTCLTPVLAAFSLREAATGERPEAETEDFREVRPAHSATGFHFSGSSLGGTTFAPAYVVIIFSVRFVQNDHEV